PAALVISGIAPWAITPLLMLGGLFLCFEGFEKIAHQWLHTEADDQKAHQEKLQAVANQAVDLVAFEQEKIKGAIRTDFILSAEIVVITLGTVAAASLGERIAVLVGISMLMTVGVYGLVAAIVKLDDLGLYLCQAKGAGSALKQGLGNALLAFAPWLMKALSVVGTAAMFMVGGGILVHGWPWLHHAVEGAAQHLGGLWGTILSSGVGALVGIVAGAIAVGLVKLIQKARPSVTPA
ncbi:MAG: hypothetical protein RLZZ612_1093, partial [Pseudomonadota bacterium]